jgi:hypothetical protein
MPCSVCYGIGTACASADCMNVIYNHATWCTHRHQNDNLAMLCPPCRNRRPYGIGVTIVYVRPMPDGSYIRDDRIFLDTYTDLCRCTAQEQLYVAGRDNITIYRVTPFHSSLAPWDCMDYMDRHTLI